MIFNSDDTYPRVCVNAGAILSSCTPHLATHDYSANGVEFRFNLAGLADEFDVARCGFFVNPEGQHCHQDRHNPQTRYQDRS